MSATPETDKLLADWLKGRSEKIPDFAALARRLERERDEAREALMKIEDVFVDGEDTYEDWRTMGNIARAALEDKV
jgi:hypothetical protein